MEKIIYELVNRACHAKKRLCIRFYHKGKYTFRRVTAPDRKENPMTQNQMILRHMQIYGRITTYEAFTDYGITRLSARIWDLRHEGHAIASKNKSGMNRFGEKTTFAEYRLVG